MKNKALASQSLWNRAVSYDEKPVEWQVAEEVSLNPFGTGQCLTTASKLMDIQDLYVSIPLEQGSVLRHTKIQELEQAKTVSIPLEQGSVLRQEK